MVDFRWQLDRAKDAQIAAGTWFPGVLEGACRREEQLRGVDAPLSVWVSACQVTEKPRAQRSGGRVTSFSLSLGMRHPSSLPSGISAPWFCLQDSDEFAPSAVWFSGLWTWTDSQQLAWFSSSQTAGHDTAWPPCVMSRLQQISSYIFLPRYLNIYVSIGSVIWYIVVWKQTLLNYKRNHSSQTLFLFFFFSPATR